MLTDSILSFPARGHYGNNRYRGNCSGFVIKALLEHYRPSLFCDPAEGGKTSRHVVAEMNKEGRRIEYVGLDLRDGFNLLKDELRERLPREADYLFFHSPYWNMVRYSGHVWGTRPHPDDLSHCETYEEFLTKLQIALHNCYTGVRRGGHYSVMVGDLRRSGEYYSLQADIKQIAPGRLEGILIKQQFNCLSNERAYNGNLIRIAHEYILNFRKEGMVFGMIDSALATSNHLQMLSNANWRAVVERALRSLGGKASLAEIYETIEQTATPKTEGRPNWTAKVRQVLQRIAQPVDRGVWALRAA